jgi:hypothetical protein
VRPGSLEPLPSLESTPSATQSTLPREILAGVIGGGVTLVCVLPPILHFVTGPLGPLIGGFVAAKQVPPSARARTVIALVAGGCIGALAATAVTIIGGLDGPRPTWLPGTETLALIVLGVAVYTAGLCALGATLGHASVEKKLAASASDSSTG